MNSKLNSFCMVLVKKFLYLCMYINALASWSACAMWLIYRYAMTQFNISYILMFDASHVGCYVIYYLWVIHIIHHSQRIRPTTGQVLIIMWQNQEDEYRFLSHTYCVIICSNTSNHLNVKDLLYSLPKKVPWVYSLFSNTLTCSRRRTVFSCLANQYAAAEPITPAPTTITSYI